MVDLVFGVVIGFFITVLAVGFFSPTIMLWLILSPFGFWQMFAVILGGIVFGSVLFCLFLAILSAIFR